MTPGRGRTKQVGLPDEESLPLSLCESDYAEEGLTGILNNLTARPVRGAWKATDTTHAALAHPSNHFCSFGLCDVTLNNRCSFVMGKGRERERALCSHAPRVISRSAKPLSTAPLFGRSPQTRNVRLSRKLAANIANTR